MELFQPLLTTMGELKKEFDTIPLERKTTLEKLARFIENKIRRREKAELNFICTHNSRRSHIAQLWTQAAAAYYGVEGIVCYSGGTEATAFNPRAVTAMVAAGFRIRKATEASNPMYEVGFENDVAPVFSFSKKYDAEGNPKRGFAAVMTCSQADHNCPLVLGTLERFSIPFDDPKDFDDTPLETEKYCDRVRQIGREMLYMVSKVKRTV